MLQDYFNKVQSLLEQNDIIEAINVANNWIKNEQENPNAYNILGMLYAQKNDLNNSLNSLEKAIKINPNESMYHNNISNVFRRIGNFVKAEMHLNQALRINPGYAEAYNNMGTLYYTQGLIDKSIPYFEKAIRMKPKYIDAHYNLGNALVKKDKITQACSHYNTVLKINSNHLQARLNLAMTLIAENKIEDAIEHLNKIINVYPKNELALIQLGQLHLELGKINEAKEFYNKVLKFNNLSEEANHNLAILYLKEQNYSEAKKYFENVYKINSNNKTASHMLNALLGKTEEPDKEFIVKLFDQYAERYNKHMKEELQYQAPHLLRQAVGKCEIPLTDERYILDLGCGTGLCGILFSDIKHKMIGIDLSKRMLLHAKTLKLYDLLCVYDINQSFPAYLFHVILAADVFCYIGNLDNIFSKCYEHLENKGIFAFTVEKSENNNYEIKKTGRFSHKKEYIENLIEKYNFKILQQENDVCLRTHNNSPVKGMLFVLTK